MYELLAKVEIRIIEASYPMAHEPADEESRSLLVATTGWSWIPWPFLKIFKEVLERCGVRVILEDLL